MAETMTILIAILTYLKEHEKKSLRWITVLYQSALINQHTRVTCSTLLLMYSFRTYISQP